MTSLSLSDISDIIELTIFAGLISGTKTTMNMNETTALSSDAGGGGPLLNRSLLESSQDSISVEQACEDPLSLEMYYTFAWWMEGVIQIVLGSLGFLANAVAIPILLSKEMSSVFNRCLTCLAIFDNIFIICSIFEAIRKHLFNSQFQVTRHCIL